MDAFARLRSEPQHEPRHDKQGERIDEREVASGWRVYVKRGPDACRLRSCSGRRGCRARQQDCRRERARDFDADPLPLAPCRRREHRRQSCRSDVARASAETRSRSDRKTRDLEWLVMNALDVHRQIAALEIEARGDKHARLVLSDLYEDLGKPSVAESWRKVVDETQPIRAIDSFGVRDDVARLMLDELPEKSFRTRKRVDKMTDAEAAQMASWAKKWIEIGLCTKPADRPLFEAAVRACYRHSGLLEPKVVVWAPCPLVVAYAGPIAAWWCDRIVDASVLASVRASVDASVRASVDASVRASVDASVRASVDASVGDSVDASVRASVRASVLASVDASVLASVDASVDASVHASVDASVDASVRASVDASVDDVGSRREIAVALKQQINDRWFHRFGGQFWSGYGYYWRWGGPPSVTFALDVLRLDIGREQELKARAYAATHASACWWWPGKTFVIVSERPSLIEKHKNGKLKVARWEWIDARGNAQHWEVRP
ncbi:MAG TPA: hypothetical protein VGG74_21115 [Kofleriaceae bacterium]